MAKNELNTRKIEKVPVGLAPRKHIRVTREDLDTAKPNSPAHCAGANCFLRMGHKRPYVSVQKDGTAAFDTWDEDTQQWFRDVYKDIPQSFIDLTYLVDAGRAAEIKPCQFWLGYGVRYRIVEWPRLRYAGGVRRGPRSKKRSDAGTPRRAWGRTARREASLASKTTLTLVEVK